MTSISQVIPYAGCRPNDMQMPPLSHVPPLPQPDIAPQRDAAFCAGWPGGLSSMRPGQAFLRLDVTLKNVCCLLPKQSCRPNTESGNIIQVPDKFCPPTQNLRNGYVTGRSAERVFTDNKNGHLSSQQAYFFCCFALGATFTRACINNTHKLVDNENL